MPATDALLTAIAAFRTVAFDSFNEALSRAQQTIQPSGTTAAEWAADKAKAKGQMVSALDQLVHADTMISEKNGRDGFSALMTSTKNTAETLYARITTIANDTTGTTSDWDARNRELDSIARVLDALARIAPIALWQKVPGTNATTP